MSLLPPSANRGRPSGGRIRSGVLAFAFLGFLASCSGDGTTDPGETPSFSITLSGTTLTITQGSNGSVNVNVTRSGGFEGAVAVTAEGLPQGVTAGALSIAAGSTSGVLQLTASAQATVGNAQITVRGTASGVQAATANLALTVNEAPANPTPDFTLALNPTSASVAQGGSTQTTATITRTGGFDGAVTLSASGLPAGVTATFNPTAPTGNTSTVTFNVGGAVTPGTYPITVQGTGTGVSNRSASFTLTVTAAATPDFTLALNPTSASVAQGGSTQTTATITRTGGFDGVVTFSATGLPTGVTAGFDPAAPAGNTSTVTFNVGGATAPGVYPITVQGAGAGVGNRTATFNLTVTAAAPSSGNTTFEFCGSSGFPVWVAVKNGNGAWTRVTGTDGVFKFDIDDIGGVAWVWPGNDGQNLDVIFGTQAELNQIGTERCVSPGAGKTVNAAFAGIAAADIIITSLGGAQASTLPTSAAPTATYSGVPDGPVDLIASRAAFDFGAFAIIPLRFFLRRGINPAAGSTIAGVNFDGTDGFAPAANPLTVTGGTALATTVSLRTAGGSFGALSVGLGGANWYGVPEARLQAGDLHVITVSAGGADLAPSQTTVRMIKNPAPVTVNLGTALTPPTVQSVAATGYSRARAEYAIQAQYNRHWMANFQHGGANPRYATIQMTQAYRGSGTGTVTLEIPDFTGVDGWNADWGLKAGNLVTWTVSGIGWEGAGVMGPVWEDGNTYTTASHMGQFTP